jgi:hypothetical protein
MSAQPDINTMRSSLPIPIIKLLKVNLSVMKSLSIIGIVLFAFSIICLFVMFDSDPAAAAGWGFIASVFGLAYSIVGLVHAVKK